MNSLKTINSLLESIGIPLKSVGFARHPYSNKTVRHLFEGNGTYHRKCENLNI